MLSTNTDNLFRDKQLKTTFVGVVLLLVKTHHHTKPGGITIKATQAADFQYRTIL
jgi:hypothetical protein